MSRREQYMALMGFVLFHADCLFGGSVGCAMTFHESVAKRKVRVGVSTWPVWVIMGLRAVELARERR